MILQAHTDLLAWADWMLGMLEGSSLSYPHRSPLGDGFSPQPERGARCPDVCAPSGYLRKVDRAVRSLPEEWSRFAHVVYVEGADPDPAALHRLHALLLRTAG